MDLQANVRALGELLERRDAEAMRLVNLILQDAYVIKDSLSKDEYKAVLAKIARSHSNAQVLTHTDAVGEDGCKARPMIYAHLPY